MKHWIALLLLVLGAYFAIDPRPYDFSAVMPSAQGYWIEYEKNKGFICRLSERLPIDDPAWSNQEYRGESCAMWIVRPKGLARDFLVFDACYGAYTLRRIVFAVSWNGSLELCADFSTVWEIQGKHACNVIDATFEDVDVDGVEEVIEARREWVSDQDGNLINNWAVRRVCHAWDGKKFVPRYTDFSASGERGPLMPCTAQRGSALGEYEAFRRICLLPETIAWAARLKMVIRGEVRGIAYTELRPLDCGAWVFYVGEDHETHTVLWNRFRVDAATSEMKVFDGTGQRFVSLREWRLGRKRLLFTDYCLLFTMELWLDSSDS